MNANNVVVFPKKKKISQDKQDTNHPQSFEEIEENMDLIRQVHVQETIETVIPLLFDQLSIAGFQPADEDGDLKEGAFVIEAVRSLLLKSYNIEHPFQIIAEGVFSEDKEGMISIMDNIKFVITTTKE